MNSRYFLCNFLIAAFSVFHLSFVAAQDASFEGGVLRIPVVEVGSQSYRIALTIVNENPVRMQVVEGVPLDSAVALSPSSFVGNRLLIPSLKVNGVTYQISLELVNDNPLTFQLKEASVVPDPMLGNVALKDALVVDARFDSDVTPIAYGSRWKVVNESGNNMLCNTAGSDWSNFYLGNASWADYTIEVDIKQVSNNANSNFEMYLRLGDNGTGYRAAVATRNFAFLSHYQPTIQFPGKPAQIGLAEWVKVRAEITGNRLRFYLNNQLSSETTVSADSGYNKSGRTGIGASPNTEICVDNIRVWASNASGPVDRRHLAQSADPNDERSRYTGECPFCFINSLPNAPVWTATRNGYLPSATDTREQIVWDETFSVNAGQTVEVNNKIIWVRPKARRDIKVNGTLRIRNSLIIWDQTQHQQTYLMVNNGGTLEITNSLAVNSNQFWINWHYNSGATVVFDGFVGEIWTSMRGSVNYTSRNFSTTRLTIFGDVRDSQINISDSHHVWLEIFPPSGTHKLVFPEKFQWLTWNLSGLWPNSNVVVTDSYIYERDLSLAPDVHATLYDTPSGFALGWTIKDYSGKVADCELRGLGKPGSDHGELYTNKTWNLPCNNSSLTLVNSRLERAWPNVLGRAHLRVYDSALADMRNFGDGAGYPTSMEIYNSSIKWLATYKGGRTYVENSTIRFDIEVKDAGSVIYGHKVTRESGSGPVTRAEIDGGHYVERVSPGRPW